ncbi:hypothetical protein FKR81_17770 [Lentzea tibetensis]|uniref:Clp R domain-containing protein n=1 Tax=Lentzea tibetensis TaxID=2591470 RepID=A0A563ETC7_9PSEU|nr:Clp protease N-terminal domain-containing protein [Lentzea tibetensis]TWP50926.1 hypothetical protein FKR81_17770 [Lentzea tibetensis]
MYLASTTWFASANRRAFDIAQEQDAPVGIDHLVLGLLDCQEGVAVHVLTALGVDVAALRTELQRPAAATPGELRMSQEASDLMPRMMDEHTTRIGTPQLLMAVLRQGYPPLVSRGVTLERAQAEIARQLADPSVPEAHEFAGTDS